MTARRIEQVQAPVIPIVGRLTRQHPGTISLGQGVVHYGPPRQVFEAVAGGTGDAGSSLLDRYGDVAGRPELLEQMTGKLRRDNGIDLVDQGGVVLCTAGANMGFLHAVLAIADPNDEIVLLAPYYFNHHMAIEIAGCRVVVAATDENHQPDLEQIRRAVSPRTRAIVTVSPNNPTGAVYSRECLTEINALCARQGLYHISDEAYEYFVDRATTHFSPGSLPGAGGHTISLFSLSKSYGMAGWRVGYCVVPEQLTVAMKKIQDTNLICPPQVCQSAAAAALGVGGEWCRQQSAGLPAVRDAALELLSELDDRCHVRAAQGAFYLFLKLDSDCCEMDLVEGLIREHGVATLPGGAFGASAGCSLRLSYGALDADTVLEGVGRLREGLRKRL